MQKYSEFRPSQFDTEGLGLEDRQDWLVVGVAQNRDSGCLTRCNFAIAVELLKAIPHSDREDDDVEVHRFGHWGNGWFEIILVRPDTKAAREAEEIEVALADYPILDENRYSDMSYQEANETWERCYSNEQRIEYIRENRSEHEFRGFAHMLGCARGRYFAGDVMSFVESC